MDQLREQFEAVQAEREVLLAENRRKNFFLNALSHDLRTPLNALSLQASVAQEFLARGDLPAVNEALSEIRENAQGVAELLCSLLEYARMELSTECKPMIFDLQSFIQQLCKGFHHSALRKGLFIHTDCPSLLITCDKIKLFRIISNLVDNAIKFTASGGVTISSTLDSGSSNVMVTISVRDTGIGIPESFRALLFTEFAQADNSERDRSKGFGLGLAITHKLVTQLDGIINVSSDDHGSCFAITIPQIPTSAGCRGQSLHPESHPTTPEMPGNTSS